MSDSTLCSAKTLLIATGANRRKLEVPGAKEFDQKGLTYCASCDGPLFADQDVAVIGGGNAAFETAMQLLAYCKSVTLFNRSDTFRADELTVEKVLKDPKMNALKKVELVAIEGDKFVSGVRYKDASGAEQLLPVTGVFVEIGLVPNTDSATWSNSMKSNKSLPTRARKRPRTRRYGPRATSPTASIIRTTSLQATP
jgi:thioredoxin reductase